MTSRADRKLLLAMIPGTLLVHALEEGLFLPATLRLAKEGFPKWYRLLVPPVPVEQQVGAILLVVVLALCALRWGSAEQNRSWGVRILLWITALMAVDCAARVVAGGMAGGYVSGIASAVALEFPLAVIIGRRAWKEGWLARTELLLLIPAGFVARGPLFFGFLFVAGYLLGLVGVI